MRFRWIFFLSLIAAIFLGACSGNTPFQITPALEKLTFISFYTDD